MKIYSYKGKANVCHARIRQARESRQITQDQLAARLQVEGVQVNQKAISRIEAGERVVADYELLVLSEALGVDVDWLLNLK